MRPDIKICGLKTPEAVDRAVERGATHIGFIFFAKSPRNIEPDIAGMLADRVRGRTKIVAVTVDADADDLDEIIALLRPDILQFHGHESPERLLTVKAMTGLPIMKAFSIREPDDLRRIEPYIGIADRFLFDAKPPIGSDLPGGNGVTFDWSLLRSLDESVNYMLSGGLNKDNIADALSETGARGIDISSGVESAPGIKDLQMMDDFFTAVAEASRRAPVSGSVK
ncbi:phosphoribosylanthranilate isomerase [Rhizobium sp. CECT 9324]|uniref:phosphoribosylanthranilate isomerase n=1 Tax=Rhizobium sp. CECT 9324 TaxID=2845820 RepID=UPI001E5C011F|nr:phosphoribosylanthranilate isomerase [Rhizobium sp. CECT 9324]CAH0338790.1 N-(5'-phosphoribosyl)anthranilate isomerase [Rhizobium sp. CECT 9324]